MGEDRIISLLINRNEQAIEELNKEYHEYIISIADNILGSAEDAEECLNDVLFSVWNSIPPNRPDNLKAYIGRIARSIAISRFRKRNSKKRSSGEATVVLEELSDLLVVNHSPERSVLQTEMDEAVRKYLSSLSRRDRNIFLCRYYYMFSSEEIAKKQGLSRNHVLTILSRTRKKLAEYLKKEGLL